MFEQEDNLYPENALILSVYPVSLDFKLNGKIKSTKSYCRLLFTEDKNILPLFELTKSHIIYQPCNDINILFNNIIESSKSLKFVEKIECRNIDPTQLSKRWPMYNDVKICEIMLKSSYSNDEKCFLLCNYKSLFSSFDKSFHFEELSPLSIHLLGYEVAKNGVEQFKQEIVE